MDAKPVRERSEAIEPARRDGPAPTPEPLRPAAGLVLGLLLSSVLWLALLVAWLLA